MSLPGFQRSAQAAANCLISRMGAGDGTPDGKVWLADIEPPRVLERRTDALGAICSLILPSHDPPPARLPFPREEQPALDLEA